MKRTKGYKEETVTIGRLERSKDVSVETIGNINLVYINRHPVLVQYIFVNFRSYKQRWITRGTATINLCISTKKTKKGLPPYSLAYLVISPLY